MLLRNELIDLKESSRNNLRIYCGIDIHKLKKKVLCTIGIYKNENKNRFFFLYNAVKNVALNP